MVEQRGNHTTRFLDAWLGPHILRVLGLRHFFRVMTVPSKPRRIGVVCVGAIGDLLLCSATLRDLRAHFPECDIVLFTSETNRSLLPLLDIGVRNEVLPLGSPFLALQKVRASRCEILLDYGQWPRISAVFAALSGAACTIGFRTPGQSRHFAYDIVIDHRNDRHELENYRDLSRALGVNCSHTPAVAEAFSCRDEISAITKSDYVLLHPWPAGTRAELKCWPIERWAEIASYIRGCGIDVVLSGGPGDRDRSAKLYTLIGLGDGVHDFSGRTSLGEAVELLRHARAVISVNTGVMHLAAAVNPALIALHGPTNPLRWGPISDTAISLVPSCEGCGYLNLGFEYPEAPPDCMGEISVEAVKRALDAVFLSSPIEGLQ